MIFIKFYGLRLKNSFNKNRTKYKFNILKVILLRY